MTRVKEIMTPDPVTLESDATLRQAIEVLQAAGVSGAPVLSLGRLAGVVSATDILEFEASSPGVPPQRQEMLEWGELDTVPEEEDGEQFPASFFVDLWADSEADVWNRMSETDSPEWDRMEEHTVAEVMTRKLVTLAADEPVAEAARRMLHLKVHRLLVVDGDTLLGIVSAFDVLREVAGEPAVGGPGEPMPGEPIEVTSLGFELRVPEGVDEAIDHVTTALRAEGFGVLTRIDLDRAFEEKIGISFDRFTILGACNPHLAHRAMTEDREVGLLLPCNVTVEEVDGGSRIRLVDPRAMMGVGRFGANETIKKIADEARTRIARVAATLEKTAAVRA